METAKSNGLTFVPCRKPKGSIRKDFKPHPDSAAVAAALSTYLSDESRLQGYADYIAFPESEAEVAYLLQSAAEAGASVTISAGRTGVVGGAVPRGGWALSVERFDRVHAFKWHEASGEFRLRVGAGVPLSALRRAIKSGRFTFAEQPDQTTIELLESFRKQSTQWIFPPDPTEATAQLGGMTASNASGARTFAFGPTRAWVRGITVVLADGRVLDLPRGSYFAQPGTGWLIGSEVATAASCLHVPAPSWRFPVIKHAAGYYAPPADRAADLIDLFIGSEGTLGVITEIEIALHRVEGKPAEVVAFFPAYQPAYRFINLLRQCRNQENAKHLFSVESIEYFCADSLAMLRKNAPAELLPNAIPASDAVAVCVGLRFHSNVSDSLLKVAHLIEDSKGFINDSLVAIDPVDLYRLERLRHALPETVNRLIASIREKQPGITKLGTDMSVADEHLESVMELYTNKLREAGLQHVIFGHIGNNHLHVNIIPHSPAEYERGRALYLEFAQQIVAMGGSVSAEHGIGKLKKYLLPVQYNQAEISAMKEIKRSLDPAWRLGPGTLFD